MVIYALPILFDQIPMVVCFSGLKNNEKTNIVS